MNAYLGMEGQVGIRIGGEEHNPFTLTCARLYMQAVVKESLRLFPPQTTFIGRVSKSDYEFVNDNGTKVCTIPKETHVQIALFQIHHSELWANGDEFDPDRFLDGTNYDMSHQPFGAGRRDCIGKSFANFVLQLVLAKLFTRFKLEACDRTEKMGGIQIKYKTATMTPINVSWSMVTPAAI